MLGGCVVAVGVRGGEEWREDRREKGRGKRGRHRVGRGEYLKKGRGGGEARKPRLYLFAFPRRQSTPNMHQPDTAIVLVIPPAPPAHAVE